MHLSYIMGIYCCWMNWCWWAVTSEKINTLQGLWGGTWKRTEPIAATKKPWKHINWASPLKKILPLSFSLHFHSRLPLTTEGILEDSQHSFINNPILIIFPHKIWKYYIFMASIMLLGGNHMLQLHLWIREFDWRELRNLPDRWFHD